MITYSEQITTTISGDWTVSDIVQMNTPQGWTSTVRYICIDSTSGNMIDSFIINYYNDDYNNWYQCYNTGSFLIDELIRVKGWNIIPPTNIENDFLN